MNDLVVLKGKKVVCDSVEVAEKFHKQHGHVLRDIENLKKDISNFGEMFHASHYEDSYGRRQPKFYINRDGFSLLAMGFTGSEAMKWKLDYIKAFNVMEKLIQEQQSSEWKFFKEQGKTVRLAETDTLKELVEYAKERGSTNYKKIYSNYSRLANKTVGIKGIKEATTMNLSFLMLIENIFIQIIQSGMKADKDYHDIYKECKVKALQLKNTVSIESIA